jgi:hypothetical protein
MKGLFIKGYDFLPKYCQECPCFTNIISPITGKLERYCRAMRFQLARDAIPISDIENGKVKDWYNITPPKWCPAEIKEI